MQLGGTRVLVVEDEVLVSMLIEDYLSELGCDVVAVASRLDDALGKAREAIMDVVILDVNLAGQVSYPVADILRARGVPFVFATGYGSAGLPFGLQGGPVLSKPFNQQQLVNALLLAKAKT